MHIEPGVVDGARIALSYATAAAAAGLAGKMLWESVRDSHVAAVATRSLVASALVFGFFELLPHYPVGVSEVHFILGATLFLMFGAGPAALGLATGLLLQGLLVAPFDLPQYGMNVTTLLVPLYGMSLLARRIIPEKTAYVDLSYRQTLALSAAFQGGIVAWVAFWAFYGQGVGAQSLSGIGSFGLAYMSVIVLEPLLDLGILAAAKMGAGKSLNGLFHQRLHGAAA